MPDELTVAALVALNGVVAISAIIHASVGFGFAFIAIPVLVLAWPEALPAVPLLVGLPMPVVMLLRERGAVEWRVLPGMLLGWAMGASMGALVLRYAPAPAVVGMTGVAILLAVAASLARAATPPRTPAICLAAGTASGFMGTTAAIGGPLLALLYRAGEAPLLRSTLAAVFTAGYLISLLVLSAAGQLVGWHARAAVALMPGLAVGLWVSRYSYRLLRGKWQERVLLGFAGLMGVASVVRAILMLTG